MARRHEIEYQIGASVGDSIKEDLGHVCLRGMPVAGSAMPCNAMPLTRERRT
jgi:hypothetical protein